MARITVVNDYPAFLEMMDAMLGSAGHDVTVLDGQEVSIDDVRNSRPDVLIIDVAVKDGGSTGWDVLALARTDPVLRSVPVIVCTADVIQTSERRDELERLGNIRVLEKPFTANELDALLGPMLSERGRPAV
jgi:CheY-like chemotaxis protein